MCCNSYNQISADFYYPSIHCCWLVAVEISCSFPYTYMSAMSSVSVAGVNLPVADEMKVLGVVLDRRLSFDRHATSVARACNFHAQAIRHIRSLLTPELALTLACSLILSRLDYCNAVLYGAPAGSIQKLQRVQNTAARIVLQAPRRSPAQPLLEQLHWLPVRQRIDYKLAVLTHKIRATSTPSYLSDHIRPRETTRQLRSSTMPLLHRPTTRTHFADRAFRCCAPSVWNSLDSETLHCSSISGFKCRLKTLLFRQTFSSTTWTVRQRLWSHPTCWRYINESIIIIIIYQFLRYTDCKPASLNHRKSLFRLSSNALKHCTVWYIHPTIILPD